MTTPSPITAVGGQPAEPARNRPRPAESPAPPVAEPQQPPADQVPEHSASGRPVTRGERIAFQLWIVCVLLTLVVTLIFFLIDKIRG
jgi:hypothetical protein